MGWVKAWLKTPPSIKPAAVGLLFLGSGACSFTSGKVNCGHALFPLFLQCFPVVAVISCFSHCYDKGLDSILEEEPCRLAHTAEVPGCAPRLVDPEPVMGRRRRSFISWWHECRDDEKETQTKYYLQGMSPVAFIFQLVVTFWCIQSLEKHHVSLWGHSIL